MRKYKVEIVVLVLELILSIFQFYDDLGALLYQDINTTFRKVLAAQIAILIVYIVFRLSSSKSELEEIQDKIDDTLSQKSKISVLDQENFYSTLGQLMSKAQHFVGLTHLSKNPPNLLESSAQKVYYDSLLKLIKTKKNVTICRIERVTFEKKDWICKLVSELGKCKNFSLFCIVGDSRDEHLPNMSVQIVDNDDIFLVALSKHDYPGGNRDIHIHDREASGIIRNYYERQINDFAVEIVRNGAVNAKNWDEIKKKMGV